MASFRIKEVLPLFQNYRFHGNEDSLIRGALGIGDALAGDHGDSVSWINDKKSHALDTATLKLGLLILSPSSFEKLKKNSCNFLVLDNPRAAFFQIIEKYFSVKRAPQIEPTAIIHESATIGKNCYLGHHVVIEKDCKIGDNTTILHHTSILEGTIIGNHVLIGCNNTIGNYGFGYEKGADGDYFLLEHIGHVIIHDHVEIHNNTCIDRGVLGTTVIHENTKIDNLVHIAHGVTIGRNSLVIANAMIAGSAVVGENSWIAPSVSVKNKLMIAPHTMTGIGAVILKDTERDFTYIGNPATTLEDYKKWSSIKKSLLDDRTKP